MSGRGREERLYKPYPVLDVATQSETPQPYFKPSTYNIPSLLIKLHSIYRKLLLHATPSNLVQPCVNTSQM